MDSIQVIHTGSPKIYIEDVERRPNLVFLLHVRSADRKLIKFWFLFLLGFITRQTWFLLGSGFWYWDENCNNNLRKKKETRAFWNRVS